ncbi:glycosyltransferase [Arthrobacter sp. Soc17.1.1.1]|uniref:glycosyltransferase n=1 Tax=Arthrobacter sp. Soc17.1.1.1 TaxID=3121277 RepID=UPI002FE46D2D
MTDPRPIDLSNIHTMSVVIPVYQGEKSLQAVIEELIPYTRGAITKQGNSYVVKEILLVFDHGPDDSAGTIRRLAEKYDCVRPIWLSRNFGQHPATLAGMASSGGDWVVTMDEDGQHDPAAIAELLDVALQDQATLVYADPTNPAPHGPVRNAASRTAKYLAARIFSMQDASKFQSFRLLTGETARSVAAYAGSGVYLDVALGWIASRTSTCPVLLRQEKDRASGYNLRSLLSHFWRMVLSSGTKGLRLVSVIGLLFALAGIALAVYLLVSYALGQGASERGWTSTMIVLLLSTGGTLFSLGIIAEYIGVSVNMAMGKPAYLIVSDPRNGPLGRKELPPVLAPTGEKPR